MNKSTLAVIFLVLAWSALGVAQKNEASFSVGVVLSSDQTATSTLPILIPCPITNPGCNTFQTLSEAKKGVAIQGMFAREIVSMHVVSLAVEVPFVTVPARDVKNTLTASVLAAPVSIVLSSSAFFFTPSARVKLWPSAKVAPFASIGGGLAHFTSGLGSGQNTGALQFGGGLDFRTPIRSLGFRAEVRDFFTGNNQHPSSLTQVSPSHLHNVFAGGGVVFKF